MPPIRVPALLPAPPSPESKKDEEPADPRVAFILKNLSLLWEILTWKYRNTNEGNREISLETHRGYASGPFAGGIRVAWRGVHTIKKPTYRDEERVTLPVFMDAYVSETDFLKAREQAEQWGMLDEAEREKQGPQFLYWLLAHPEHPQHKETLKKYLEPFNARLPSRHMARDFW